MKKGSLLFFCFLILFVNVDSYEDYDAIVQFQLSAIRYAARTPDHIELLNELIQYKSYQFRRDDKVVVARTLETLGKTDFKPIHSLWFKENQTLRGVANIEKTGVRTEVERFYMKRDATSVTKWKIYEFEWQEDWTHFAPRAGRCTFNCMLEYIFSFL